VEVTFSHTNATLSCDTLKACHAVRR
jgi:hypothetical protein